MFLFVVYSVSADKYLVAISPVQMQMQKSMAKQLGKHRFGKIVRTEAHRKGGLLRGKVSQGRPYPLRHSVKVLRSDPVNKRIAER